MRRLLKFKADQDSIEILVRYDIEAKSGRDIVTLESNEKPSSALCVQLGIMATHLVAIAELPESWPEGPHDHRHHAHVHGERQRLGHHRSAQARTPGCAAGHQQSAHHQLRHAVRPGPDGARAPGPAIRRWRGESTEFIAVRWWPEARNKHMKKGFHPSMVKNLIGQRFGRLVVIALQGRQERGNTTYISWICLCDCGRKCEVRSSDLHSGNTKSCGCLRSQLQREKHTVHGGRRSRLYKIWSNMIARCEREGNNRYRFYGERGIKVCNIWRHDFAAFREWALSHGYSDNLTIDRIDNDKNYSPSNCQWITRSENTSKARRQKIGKGCAAITENCPSLTGGRLGSESQAVDLYKPSGG